MNIELLDFQKKHVSEFLKKTLKAKRDADELEAVLLSAPTGSGKTVMMASIIESVYSGTETFEKEEGAIFLWVSDQPELNQQSRNRIISASSILTESNLIVIDSDFDQDTFDEGKVYFLNTQKLGKDKVLTKKGDKRTWTIWETISNTVKASGKSFYCVIDEAHRGMGSDSEVQKATSIMQKFIVGSPGEIPPLPLILGISATPEKFERLLDKKTSRDVFKITVPPEDVRESGLLKENLITRLPEDNQPTDWSLLAAAAQRWKLYCSEWGTYCLSQSIPIVEPILVIQVEDGNQTNPSKTNLETIISTVESVVGPQDDDSFAHCFMEDAPLVVGARSIRKLEASKIDSDPKVKFVIFKMALTTGWDCPRAEIMMSFRKAVDYTLIAQLIGRMVRTPLARFVEGSDVLNDVHLYLPHFDKLELEKIVNQLKKDSDNVPATNVTTSDSFVEFRPTHVSPASQETITIAEVPNVSLGTNSSEVMDSTTPYQAGSIPELPTSTSVSEDTLSDASSQVGKEQPKVERVGAESASTNETAIRESVPTKGVEISSSDDQQAATPENQHLANAFAVIENLPTYKVSKANKQPSYRRLLQLAHLLTVMNGIDPNALDEAKSSLVDSLISQMNTLEEADEDFRSALQGLSVITIRPHVYNTKTMEWVQGDLEEVDVTEENVEDVYRQAKYMFDESVCIEFIRRQFDEDEPHRAKLALFLLLNKTSVMTYLEGQASRKFNELRTRNNGKIKQLSNSEIQPYQRLWQSGREIESDFLRLPQGNVKFPAPSKTPVAYEKHIYQNESGMFTQSFNSWEHASISREIPTCVGWLRNLDRRPWALAYTYEMDGEVKPGFPDFIVVRQDETGSYLVDILEPHRGDLADSWCKAKGLANYVDKHGHEFGRVLMQRVSSDGKSITSIDFNNEEVKKRALRLASPTELNNLFSELGECCDL